MADDKSSGNAPVEPKVEPNPGSALQTPSQPSKEDQVVLSKKDYDQLARDAARAASAQREADRLTAENRKFGKKKLEQPESLQAPEMLRAKSIITSRLLGNKDYQQLTAENPTLARALIHDPSILLDEDEFFDGQDLADQVFKFLDQEVDRYNAGKNPVAAQPIPSNPAPLPESINPASDIPPAKSYEEHEAAKPDNRPLMERISSKIQSKVKE